MELLSIFMIVFFVVIIVCVAANERYEAKLKRMAEREQHEQHLRQMAEENARLRSVINFYENLRQEEENDKRN